MRSNRVKSVPGREPGQLKWVGQLRHDLAGVTNALQTLLGSGLEMAAPARQILELSVERLNRKLSELDTRQLDEARP